MYRKQSKAFLCRFSLLAIFSLAFIQSAAAASNNYQLTVGDAHACVLDDLGVVYRRIIVMVKPVFQRA